MKSEEGIRKAPKAHALGALEQVKGVEPSYRAWEARVLPMNYTCISDCSFIIADIRGKSKGNLSAAKHWPLGLSAAVHQDDILPEPPDRRPGEHQIRLPSQKAEQPQPPGEDDALHLPAVRVEGDVVHKAVPGAAGDVNDLFVPKFRDSVFQSPSPPFSSLTDVYAPDEENRTGPLPVGRGPVSVSCCPACG